MSKVICSYFKKVVLSMNSYIINFRKYLGDENDITIYPSTDYRRHVPKSAVQTMRDNWLKTGGLLYSSLFKVGSDIAEENNDTRISKILISAKNDLVRLDPSQVTFIIKAGSGIEKLELDSSNNTILTTYNDYENLDQSNAITRAGKGSEKRKKGRSRRKKS